MRPILTCLLLWLPLAAQTSDEKEVPAVVQKVFDGMTAKDAAMILASMIPEARLYGVSSNGAAYSMPAEQWANRIGGVKSAIREHFIKPPTISIHGTIANVWGEYEFLRDGKLSHCGVDSFNLLKTADGWRVASIMDTEETTGCAAAK